MSVGISWHIKEKKNKQKTQSVNDVISSQKNTQKTAKKKKKRLTKTSGFVSLHKHSLRGSKILNILQYYL